MQLKEIYPHWFMENPDSKQTYKIISDNVYEFSQAINYNGEIYDIKKTVNLLDYSALELLAVLNNSEGVSDYHMAKYIFELSTIELMRDMNRESVICRLK